MRSCIVSFLMLVLFVSVLSGFTVSKELAFTAAEAFLESAIDVELYRLKEDSGQLNNNFYLFELEPQGFILTSTDQRLKPIIGYSYYNDFVTQSEHRNMLSEVISRNQSNLLTIQSSVEMQENREKWLQRELRDRDFQQWPPEGSTTTGGWLETNWTQTHPYNSMCPMDPSTNVRSIAGCPSIAVAQIFNYHRTINQTRFDQGDSYRMYVSGTNNYSIDGAAATLDFPSFVELNGYLDDVESVYSSIDEELSNDQKAALVFASGVAIKQAYSSSASGNYFDTQIINAYHRFGFASTTMLFENSALVSERLIQNMKQGLPAQLSLLTGDGSGHQLVVDGYNTDDQIHLNFGWGGQANGWYNFPISNMPYQLNIFATAFLDINQEWDGSPQFELSLLNTDSVINGNVLQFEIANSVNGAEVYEVFINDELIAEYYTEGIHTLSIVNYENGYHELTVAARNAEQSIYVANLYFEIGRGEPVFAEYFENNWLDYWSIESSSNDFSWQALENSFISFSKFNADNSVSATCPLAYSYLNENLTSPYIQLPVSSDLKMLFYAGYSDMYPAYPSLKLQISQDYGTSWEDLWQSTGLGLDWKWHRIQIDMTNYGGQEIYLRFNTNGFSYNDVSIDHLVIYDESNVNIIPEKVPGISGFSVYPNPVMLGHQLNRNTETKIEFYLEKGGAVSVELFDIRGRKMDTILSGNYPSGKHNVIWNGFYSSGKQPANGVYFLKIKTDDEQQFKKLMILR